MKFGVLFAAAAVALAAGSASAATVIREISFTAYAFEAYAGALPAPTDPLTGVIRVTYDTDADQDPTEAGLDVISLNFTGLPAQFSVYTSLGTSLYFGSGLMGGGGFNVGAPGSFGVIIDDLGGTPHLSYAQYVTEGGNYYTFKGDVMVASVPEPTTWTMLISGFALAGARLRRRFAATA